LKMVTFIGWERFCIPRGESAWTRFSEPCRTNPMRGRQ
jgi:hypothetical protein